MISGKELEAFEAFDHRLHGASHRAIGSVHDNDKLVRLIMNLYREGSDYRSLNGDLVRAWAESKSWPPEKVNDLGVMCDTIYETLVQLGHVPN
jgi:hypothetical protein